MEDRKIVELYWERSEDAISETQKKYGKYCHSIAYGILCSNEDAEECVNDAYSRLWKSIPPRRPKHLSAFIAKITRNLALDRYDRSNAQKRGGNTEEVYLEFEECVPDTKAENLADKLALKTAVNGFLSSLGSQERKLFMRRYWYFGSIKDIADEFGLSESAVKTSLFRTRMRFKAYLENEGIEV